jgi:hypothetical protein
VEKGRILSLGRVNDLEVEQDLDFQQRMWAFERAGWIVMLLVISAALAGFFHHGNCPSRPWTRKTRTDQIRSLGKRRWDLHYPEGGGGMAFRSTVDNSVSPP